MHAGEFVLGLAISLVDHTALRTGSAGVARIDGNDGYAGKLRLVTHELAKLGKRPPMRTVALRLCGLNPLADMRQVFDHNRAAGAFGVSNDLLADNVVGMFAEACLLSAKFLQAAFGGLGAALL